MEDQPEASPASSVAPASEPARARLPRAVVGLGWVSLLTDVSSEMIFPLLPRFIDQTLGAGKLGVGLIEGAAESTAAILRLPSGVLSDRLSRRKPILYFGYGLAGLVRPLVGLATAMWQVLLIRFLDRTGKGLRGAPRDALIADAAAPGLRGRAYGFHRAMDHAGAAIGPVLATLFLLVWPDQVRSLFLITIVPAIAVLFVLWRAVPEERRDRSGQDRGRRLEQFWSLSKFPVRFRIYLASIFLFTLGNSSDAFLLLRAEELGLRPAFLPLLWFVFHVGKSGANLMGGRWSDSIEPRRLILLGWLVYALVYVGFGMATTAAQAVGLFFAYTIFYGLTEPAEKALVAQWAPAEIRGAAFGWYSLALGVAALPASLAFGWIWQRTALGAAGAFGFGALLAAVGAAVLSVTFLWEQGRPDPPARG